MRVSGALGCMALGLAFPATAMIATENDSPLRALESSTTLTVRYFDPSRGRRVPSLVGDIDEQFDIEATLHCDEQPCRDTLRRIPVLFSTLRRRHEPCSDMRYMRIELGGSSDRPKRIYVYSSGCVSMDGQYFTSPQSLLWTLRNTPVADW